MSSRLRLLDGFELTCGRSSVSLPPQGQRLVALLALNDRPLLRLRVASTLWLDTTDDRAQASLRSALWRVNSCGGRLVETTAHDVRLARHVDVDLRAAITIALRLIDGSIGPSDLRQAQAVLIGDVLPDWYDDWVLVERERFRQLRLHALESLCERLTAAGDLRGALRAGLTAVAADPIRESAHRALIKVHLAEGNHGEAIRQYRMFRELLRVQLGLEPSSHIEDLVPGFDGSGVGGVAPNAVPC